MAEEEGFVTHGHNTHLCHSASCSRSVMSDASSSVEHLPLSLILLIHLHILQFPQINKPEYDLKMFDASKRGLRERSRLMEDICFFLVSKLLGGKEKAKRVRKILHLLYGEFVLI